MDNFDGLFACLGWNEFGRTFEEANSYKRSANQNWHVTAIYEEATYKGKNYPPETW